MLTYLMVARVAQLCPGAVLTKLDKLVEPLKLTVTTKVSIVSLYINHSIYKKRTPMFYSLAVFDVMNYSRLKQILLNKSMRNKTN